MLERKNIEDSREEHGLASDEQTSVPESKALKADYEKGLSSPTPSEATNHRIAMRNHVWLLLIRREVDYAYTLELVAPDDPTSMTGVAGDTMPKWPRPVIQRFGVTRTGAFVAHCPGKSQSLARRV